MEKFSFILVDERIKGWLQAGPSGLESLCENEATKGRRVKRWIEMSFLMASFKH